MDARVGLVAFRDRPIGEESEVLLFAGGWWLISARTWFKGPKVQGTEEELAAIERDLVEVGTAG